VKADDGSRTRDLRLGKPTLYQLSYVRACANHLQTAMFRHCELRPARFYPRASPTAARSGRNASPHRSRCFATTPPNKPNDSGYFRYNRPSITSLLYVSGRSARDRIAPAAPIGGLRVRSAECFEVGFLGDRHEREEADDLHQPAGVRRQLGTQPEPAAIRLGDPDEGSHRAQPRRIDESDA
jgi:hypothetical protein